MVKMLVFFRIARVFYTAGIKEEHANRLKMILFGIIVEWKQKINKIIFYIDLT